MLVAITFRLDRRGQAVRHHLHADARGAGNADVHDLVLPLLPGLRALPPRTGHRRRMDVHDRPVGDLVLARPPAAEAGRGMRRRPRPAAARPASSGDAVSRAVALGLHRRLLHFLAPPALLGARHSVQAAGGSARAAAGLVPARIRRSSHFGSGPAPARTGSTGSRTRSSSRSRDRRLAVVVGTAAAYSMARFATGGKHLAFWFLSQRLLPPVAIVIPVFLLYSQYSREWLGDQADRQPISG